ncbi:MAG: glycosyltransferase [Bacteroidetes bacterium]|nr:glycosyltransferase [Bacteroidota bacterium]
MKNKFRILVAPLNWGLGHATRSIPIINELLKNNIEVVLVSNNGAGAFLKKEFPQLEYYELAGINLNYGNNLIRSIFAQFPKVIKSFFLERSFINNKIIDLNIDGIISDSRFGLYSSKVFSIYITHQLNIQVPKYLFFLSNILNFLHHKIISKYSKCWVLDTNFENNFAGNLSLAKKDFTNIKYIGPITRFKKKAKNKKNIFLAILSGPEPHRTNFELILIHQAFENNVNLTIVRGINGTENPFKISNKVTIYNTANTKLLTKLLDDSELLISRSGYSTLMDLSVLEKKAILVPTPGQTEQEYLATYHKSKNNFYFVDQNKFNLKDILNIKTSLKDYKYPKNTSSSLNKIIKDFLQHLK